jgi:hypothetical protein
MAKQKDFIQRAKEKGVSKLPASVNGERVLKKLEPSTEKAYQRKLDEWDRYVHTVEYRGSLETNCCGSFVKAETEEGRIATVSDVESLKGFVYLQAASIDGTNELDACVETVRNYWNRFTAGWKRKHEAIREDIVETVTNVSMNLPYQGPAC